MCVLTPDLPSWMGGYGIAAKPINEFDTFSHTEAIVFEYNAPNPTQTEDMQ